MDGCADLVSQSSCSSTRGAVLFHDPVRDGTGWVQHAQRTPNGSPFPSSSAIDAALVHALTLGCIAEQSRDDQASPRASVRVRSTRHRASTARLSIRLVLPRPYQPQSCEVTRLVAGFALRCFQRFALPTVATQAAGRPTPAPPAGRPARSSRTRASPTQSPNRPHRIETELSHDVLNPARVPISSANSRTLGTDSSPRM